MASVGVGVGVIAAGVTGQVDTLLAEPDAVAVADAVADAPAW